MIEAIIMGLALAWVIQGIFNILDERAKYREEDREEARAEEWRIYQANKGNVL